MELLMGSHNGSSLGSKTTHFRLDTSVCSINNVIRRTGTYFDCANAGLSATSVRAPNTTFPIPTKLRRQLIDNRFSTPCCGSFMTPEATGPVVPSSDVAIPAGAFHTPRTLSVVAYTPATYPLGATAMTSP